MSKLGEWIGAPVSKYKDANRGNKRKSLDEANRRRAKANGTFNEIYGKPGYKSGTIASTGVSGALGKARRSGATQYGGASAPSGTRRPKMERFPKVGTPSPQARIASTGSAVGDAVKRARLGKKVAGGSGRRRSRVT